MKLCTYRFNICQSISYRIFWYISIFITVLITFVWCIIHTKICSTKIGYYFSPIILQSSNRKVKYMLDVGRCGHFFSFFLCIQSLVKKKKKKKGVLRTFAQTQYESILYFSSLKITFCIKCFTFKSSVIPCKIAAVRRNFVEIV